MGYPGGPGHLPEASPLVPVEGVGAVVGEVQVDAAVAVVVRRGDPHAPTCVSGPKFPGDLGETPFPVVAVQGGARLGPLGKPAHAGAVGEEDVEVAVAVLVEEGDPSGGAFEDQLLFGGAADYGSCEPRLGGDVDEAGVPLPGGCGRAGTGLLPGHPRPGGGIRGSSRSSCPGGCGGAKDDPPEGQLR